MFNSDLCKSLLAPDMQEPKCCVLRGVSISFN